MQFLDILGPLFLIKEILVRTPAAIEKIDTPPVVERIWAILLNRTPSECNSFLYEPTEWCNTLGMFMRRLKCDIGSATYSSRPDHNNRALRIGRKAESGSTDMNGSLVDRSLTMGTPRTFDSICGEQDRGGLDALANKRCLFIVGGVFKVEKEIGTDTKDGALWDTGTSRFVFEHDTRDVDRAWV